MNDLTTLNNISMTTLEIAERTGKLHKSVLRDTRVMLLKLYDKKDENRFVLT
jgi:phage regulator Rha-like protein